jgi:hypothetical protein
MKKQEAPTNHDQPEEIEVDHIYANNVSFEPSLWDLKLIFGQLDQHGETPSVDWHTAATIPWLCAKIVSYYLQMNIAGYEAGNGKIRIPAEAIPPPIDPPSGDSEDEAAAIKFYEFAKKLHKDTFG